MMKLLIICCMAMQQPVPLMHFRPVVEKHPTMSSHRFKMVFNLGMDGAESDEGDEGDLAFHIKVDAKLRYLLPNGRAKLYVGEQLPNIRFGEGKYTTYLSAKVFIFSTLDGKPTRQSLSCHAL